MEPEENCTHVYLCTDAQVVHSANIAIEAVHPRRGEHTILQRASIYNQKNERNTKANGNRKEPLEKGAERIRGTRAACLIVVVRVVIANLDGRVSVSVHDGH